MDRKEQIEKARELLACGALSQEACDAIKRDFPELQESEYERIGNLVYCVIRDTPEVARVLSANGVSVNDALTLVEVLFFANKRKQDANNSANKPANTDEDEKNWKAVLGYVKDDALRVWLEKQKEQKPVPALDRGDEIILKAICEELKDAPGWVERIEGWYSLAKDAQQHAEWSEEDKKKIIFLERLIEHNVPEGQYGWADGNKGGFVTKQEAISMLESIRPQPHWKPSEEQMAILDKVYHYLWADRNATADMQDGLGDLIEDLKKL